MLPTINLGDQVEDKVTGVRGTATGRADYLHGSPRIQVEWLDDKGQPRSEWFDEDRLLITGEE